MKSLRRDFAYFATRNHAFMATIEASLTGLRVCLGLTFDLEGLTPCTGSRDAVYTSGVSIYMR